MRNERLKKLERAQGERSNISTINIELHTYLDMSYVGTHYSKSYTTYSTAVYKLPFCLLLSKLYNNIAHPPRSEKRGGGERGQTPPGLLRRQPHASIRKLESTPTPTGYVETLTPAGHTKKTQTHAKATTQMLSYAQTRTTLIAQHAYTTPDVQSQCNTTDKPLSNNFRSRPLPS